ncbi:MAG: DUF5717 family protein [Lachnospiraceae bacterium]|nr:DUF5717 family protein [Lachnospiraceae bacterium]
MREIVDRILSGKFDYEKGSLEISSPKIELSLCPGDVYTGSFFVSGTGNRLTEGHLYSNDIRLELITDSFSGPSQEVGYTFSAMGLEEGDVVQGDIYIISNQGEYYLPYTVTVQNKVIDSSLGSIRNLFHFTNLAKANWEEAVKLFYSDNFISVFNGADKRYRKTYLGLSKYYGNEQNVEEFLLAINKKHAVEYICDTENITVRDPEGTVEERISVTRNGWGYTRLYVYTDADFITLHKTEITDSDFLGNYLSFPFEIDSSKLHVGNDFGTITFRNSYVSFSVKVTVAGESVNRQDFSKYLELWHLRLDLMTYFEAFRMKKISMDKWLSESKQIVDRMLTVNDRMTLARLYKAQILLTEERYNEAKWILDQIETEFLESKRYNSPSWAYYLYLTTLYNRDETYVDEITAEVENIYLKDPGASEVAWLLLYLSEEYVLSPSRKWLFIERQVTELNCSSPFLYIEALNLLFADPSMLVKLGRFELILMRYAAKNDLIDEELARQFVYVALKEHNYSDAVYEILKTCYDVSPTDETIRAICELLILGDKTGEEYYPWYLAAIERELRITKLYEYYVNSLDLNKEYAIPKMVYLYFSYESSLEWERAAYIYARVVALRSEMPEVYDNYRDRMERFVTSEMFEGHINRDLAQLYRFILPDFALTEDMSTALAKILFVQRVQVNSDDISAVAIYHSKENTESVYPVTNRVAYVPIYDRDYTLVFEDRLSNRYIKSVDYELEKLIVPGKLSEMILSDVKDNLEFDVYVCESRADSQLITEENRERYRHILESPIIDADYKNEVRNNLMQYYFYNDRIRELDEVLDETEPRGLTRAVRSQVIRYMVLRGMFDKAIEWVTAYGIEEVEPKDLVKLCSKLISRDEFAESPAVTRIAASIFFKGKYDEIMLKYLVAYYHGMTRDMRKLFKAAENFDLDLYTMCENMLVQMLYTGYYVPERMDIYKRFVKGGASLDIRRAFLSECAFEFFVKEQVMEGYVFEEIARLEMCGEKMLTVCKLAYLKYYSEYPASKDDTAGEIIVKYLNELLDEGIYMSFFKEFLAKEPRLLGFSDKTVIEYKTEPGRRVYIHYIIENDDDTGGEYMTEEMPDIYGGVHAKSFVLFFGENLLYYVTETTEAEELLTESGNISKSDISESPDSRFNQINDIAIAKTLGDFDTVDNLLYEYYKHDYVVKRMFKLQ